MKKIIICSALLLSTTMAFAQSEHNKFNKGENQAKYQEHKEKLSKELNLTAEQKLKLDEVMEKYKKEKKDSHKAKKEEIKKILTPEQQEKMKEIRKNKHHKEI